MKDTPQPFVVLATMASGPSLDASAEQMLFTSWPSISMVVHAKGAKLVCKRVEVGNLLGRTEALHAIQIDKEGEVIEFLVGQKI